MYTVTTFYRFVPLPDYEQLKPQLDTLLAEHGMKGTILLAEEGINSTISGTREGIDALYAWLEADDRLTGMEYKEHESEFMPFLKAKVRLKKYIVNLGLDVDMSAVGEYLGPDAWDNVISDPETVVIDTRNIYEVQLGTFKNAVNPNITDFKELPAWVEKNLNPDTHKKVAMFCTGGIRCEKSTALMKQMGYENVYHLKGGILKYLEETQGKEHLWEGSCFVFDDRIALDDNLEPAGDAICRFCATPATYHFEPFPGAREGYTCPECSRERGKPVI